MKILVADKIAPQGVAHLKNQPGFEVVEAYGSSPEKVVELSRDAAAIIVRSETKITAEVFAAARELKVVGRAGVGVDNIDVDAATERGVIVMNTPSGNTIATAELTFTHMLCGARPVAQANASMQGGKWERKHFTGTELRGKVLGVLGMGRIGGEVARRAQAFEMQVVAYDPYLTAARAKSMGVELAPLDEVFRRADFITVHMPLTDSTRNMIDAAAIGKMKKGVRLFNCARGGIIDEAALVEGVRSGKVAAAGLDVFEDEPLPADSPLRGLANIVLTPHLGASTTEAQESVGIEIAEAVTNVLNGGVVQNAVNMPSVDAHTLKALRPYLVLGEKIGSLLQQITPDQVDKIKITYWGKIIDLDAMPLTRAIQRGYLLRIIGQEVNDVNAPGLMKQLGIEVEVTKSNSDAGFTELIEVRAVCSTGKTHSVAGTLFGTAQAPRVVKLYDQPLEICPEGTLLLLRNLDVPGTIGKVGTALGKDGVNIANLSLSRDPQTQRAISVFELDSRPSEQFVAEIKADSNFTSIQILQL